MRALFSILFVPQKLGIITLLVGRGRVHFTIYSNLQSILILDHYWQYLPKLRKFEWPLRARCTVWLVLTSQYFKTSSNGSLLYNFCTESHLHPRHLLLHQTVSQSHLLASGAWVLPDSCVERRAWVLGWGPSTGQWRCRRGWCEETV